MRHQHDPDRAQAWNIGDVDIAEPDGVFGGNDHLLGERAVVEVAR